MPGAPGAASPLESPISGASAPGTLSAVVGGTLIVFEIPAGALGSAAGAGAANGTGPLRMDRTSTMAVPVDIGSGFGGSRPPPRPKMIANSPRIAARMCEMPFGRPSG